MVKSFPRLACMADIFKLCCKTASTNQDFPRAMFLQRRAFYAIASCIAARRDAPPLLLRKARTE